MAKPKTHNSAPSGTEELSERERRFVEAYMGEAAGNATKAAELAGYSARTARQIGSRLLSKVDIQQVIYQRQQVRAEKSDVDAALVIRELARLGFSNVQGLFTDGSQLRDIGELTEDMARAVASVEVVRRRTEEKGVEEYLHKIKLWDKNSALEKIAKCLGMYAETVRHEGELVIKWQD